MERKMKLALCSDVHLEFGQLHIENTQNAEVLLLSGDICTAKDLLPTGLVGSGKYDRFMEFFTTCSREFPHVVYIMGNHEHYHGDFITSIDIIRNALAQFENIHVLEKEVWVLGEYQFIGGTLWTDMNGGDVDTMTHVEYRMNDFNLCYNGSKVIHYTANKPLLDENGEQVLSKHGAPQFTEEKIRKTRTGNLSPSDTVEDHKKMLDFIHVTTEGKYDQKFIVVGHHAPSKGSEHPKYMHDTLMNGAYNSVLDDFIMDRPQIKLWTHGHTHEDFDYMIGSTRVVCNPRGYINHEERAETFKLKYIEV
jgi:predicted phosphodiesterase